MSRKSEIIPIDRRQGHTLDFEFVRGPIITTRYLWSSMAGGLPLVANPAPPRRDMGVDSPRLHRARQERWRGHRGLLRRQGTAVRGYPTLSAPSGLRAGARYALASARGSAISAIL